jgi:peptidyl-dipeptidase Dcp
MPAAAKSKSTAKRSPNTLLQTWRTPLQVPPYARIRPADYGPAFKEAMRRHREEIAAIGANPAKPTFANTITALEKSGRLLSRIASLFFNLAGADTNDELQTVERDIAPKLSQHESAIMLDAKLFRRIDDLYQRRDALKLDPEQRRVLELQHLWFVRAGAKLAAKDKKRVAAINERLATLATQVSQNVLKDEQSWRLVLDGERDLAGLPPNVRANAARAAEAAGLSGKHVVTLARSSVETFLTFSSRRDLREEAFNAWIRRGETGGPTDNRKLIAEMIALRAELAGLLGYDTYAGYSLAETMAKTPAAVRELLGAVWPKAKAKAAEEARALQKLARTEGGNFDLAPWDWRYYAEKERKVRYDLDEAEIRPYLQLDNMIAAAFDCASRLFGLSFEERDDLPKYHPDVRTWEVKDAHGRHVAVFLGDYFARPSKRSGAWMSSYRSQHKLNGEVRPIVVNVLNFAQGAPGKPTLLSFDDARTLFHEFGHGLHGMLSDVTFPSISGTGVVRDFVELPSQLYEHWVLQPDVLKRFALHAETGKPMPETLLKRIKAARNFNMGFATVEYTACALVDMDLHAASPRQAADITAFERETLDRIGMPREIVMRHRIPHFLHIVGGYAAGYYSYLWSEVMDADAFAAFEEAGDIFHADTAKRLRDNIYAAGNRRDPLDSYVAFRGRPPRIDSLMAKRGFAG